MSNPNIQVKVNGPQALSDALRNYGTIILKPNVQDNRNVLTQEMMSKANTKYVIQWNYDLMGQTINVPVGCMIEFNGGTVTNGTIVGNNTILLYDKNIDEIFTANREGTFIYNTTVADEEDITSETGQLKFKDKTYNPDAYSGLAKKILRKNMVNGINTLTQAMVSAANTIYVIQYDFTLGEDITIPANCVLEFDGGSISGEYTLTGQNTGIEAGLIKIFNTNVTFAGSWNVAEAYPEWFGDVDNNIEYADKLADVKLSESRYYVNRQISLKHNVRGISSISFSNPTGTINTTQISKVIYIGNGGSALTPDTETENSIFLVHEKCKLEISNILFFTASQRFTNESMFSTLYKAGQSWNGENGYRMLFEDKDFSAIKYTSDTAVGYSWNIIKDCLFIYINIGVLYHDKSMSGGASDKSTTGNIIDTCEFLYCNVNIWINNTNTYCNTIKDCTSSFWNKHFIKLTKGTFIMERGFIGNCTGTPFSNPAILIESNAKYYQIKSVYTEHTNSVFLEDNREVVASIEDRYPGIISNCILIRAQNNSYKYDIVTGENSRNAILVVDSSTIGTYKLQGTNYVISRNTRNLHSSDTVVSTNSKLQYELPALLRRGASNTRPTSWLNSELKGVEYFDTTLNKPIYWNGTDWVDATGTTV